MANSGASQRTASAMASDGRLDSTVSVPLGAAQVQLGEVRVVAHLGDDDLLERRRRARCSVCDEQVVGQRTGRRRRPRGRSGSTSPPACRCRSAAGGCRPVCSRRSTIGVLAGTSTRTPTSSSGTTLASCTDAAAAARPGRCGERSAPACASGSRYWRSGRAHQRRPQRAPRAFELVEVGERLGAGLGVALAQQRAGSAARRGRPRARPTCATPAGGGHRRRPAGTRRRRRRSRRRRRRTGRRLARALGDDAVLLELRRAGRRVTDAIAHSSSRLTSTPGSRRGDDGRGDRRPARSGTLRRSRRVGRRARRGAGRWRQRPAALAPCGRVGRDDGWRRSVVGVGGALAAPMSPAGASTPRGVASPVRSISPESMRSLITRSGRKFSRCSRRMTRSSSTSSSKNLR